MLRGAFWVTLGAAGLILGCGDAQVHSCEHEASRISMAANVTDDDDGVEAEVSFEAGGAGGAGSSLRLCDGKGESLKINDVELELTETYAGSFKYRASLERSSSYELDITIGSDKVRIESSLLAPAAFEIDAPIKGEEVSRSEDFLLLWGEPSPGDSISIELLDDEILCLDDWNVETEDDGMHSIPANTIIRTDPEAPDGKCEAEYVFTRARTGEYPSQLRGGGSLEAFVRRAVRFSSVL